MALQNIVDYIIRAKATGTKQVQTEVNTMVSSVDNGSQRVNKILRGQAKLTRRLAAQNKKAFTLAAVGMGPLIRAYANVAASIFALGGVWDAVNIGAKFEQTSVAFKSLSTGFGVDSTLIIADLKALAGGALTTQEVMEQAALGIASGLTTVQLEKLTIVARKAANVMGRTMPDAFSRLIKGVTKLEPELLDELGITTKLGPALIRYAKATGKAVTQITQLEKVQLFANLAAKEGAEKFKDVDVSALSYSERLQKLKTSLVDFSTEAAAKAIPTVTKLFEIIAASSSEILFLATAYGVYRVATLGSAAATRIQSAANLLEISLEKQQLKNIEALTIAELALSKARNKALNIAKAKKTTPNKIESANNKTRLAEIQVEELRNQKKVIAGNIAETRSTKLLARSKRGLAKAAGFLGKGLSLVTKAFLPLFIIFQVLEATGLLTKAWEFFAGKTIPTLEDKVNSLTQSQISMAGTMAEMGIKTEAAVDKILTGDVVLSNFSENTKTLSNRVSGLVTIMQTLGGLKFVTKVQNAAVAELNVKAKNITGEIKRLEEKLKNAPSEGWFTKFFGKGTDIDLTKTAILDLNRELAKTLSITEKATGNIIAKAAEPLQFVVDSAASSSDTQTKLTSVGIKTPLEDAVSAKDKAKRKVQVLDSIDVTGKLIIQNDALKQAEVSLREEEALGEAASKINLVSKKKIVEQIKEKIKILKVIPTLEKLAREEERKGNKPKKSDSGLRASATLAFEIKALKAKKSLQTKDVNGTIAYFEKLGSLEEEANKLSFDRKKADINNSIKSAEEKKAAIITLELKFQTERARIVQESDDIVRENIKSGLRAVADNESLSIEERLTALQAFNQIVLEKTKGSIEEIAGLKDKQRREENNFNDNELAKKGNFFEALAAKGRIAAKDLASSGSLMADGFLKAGNIIQDALVNKVATSLGLLTDVAKQQFAEQVNAAQSAFQQMVQAANEAFGSSLNSGALSSDRALQDLQRKRDRQVADLTAKRDTGGLTQDGFNTGLDKINLDFSRGQQDIGIGQDRGKEDAGKKRQKSLLDAQKQLNKELLKANKVFAKENNKVWDDMYGALKSTALSVLTDILKAEFVKATSSLAITTATETTKIGVAVAGAETNVALTAAEELAKGPIKGAGIFATIVDQIGLPGLVIGAAIAGAAVAAIVSAASKGFSAPSIPAVPVGTLQAPAKFHAGGILSGTQSEVPFIGMTGEGILNKHNGMKAVGGESGLNTANATGSIQTPTSGTPVTIQFVSQDGEVKDSLTIENFEDFLRNQGSRQIHNVSQDGYIILDKRAISGL